jgi:hypothetical protein
MLSVGSPRTQTKVGNKSPRSLRIFCSKGFHAVIFNREYGLEARTTQFFTRSHGEIGRHIDQNRVPKNCGRPRRTPK